MAGKLLARQLKRGLAVPDEASLAALLAQLTAGQVPEGFANQLTLFLGMVDEAYAQFERDLALRSRSLELSSAELNAANDRLRAESDSQQRVIESLQATAQSLLERAGGGVPQPMGVGQTVEREGNLEALSQLVTRLIEETQRAEEDLRASEERLNLALAATEDGLWDWNPQTGEVFFSERWKAMLGYSEAEVSNEYSSFERLVHPEDLSTLRPYLQESLVAAEGSYNVEFRMLRKDGTWCWVHSTGKVVQRDAAGAALRMVGTHHDTSSSKAAQLELLRAKRSAEAASKAKSDFMANVSHELRTPMNGIIGMADLTLGTEITPEQREYLSTLKVSADNLLTIINDILDFSQLEVGQLGVDMREFSIAELLDTLMPQVQAAVTDKGLLLKQNLQLPAESRYIGDFVRIRQVLLNILGNAIKFTERGTVSLQIDAVEGGLCLAVTDTGIGIPRDKLSLIFDAFAQGDTSRTREYGGTGLGLTISRSLVDLMGGSIKVSSALGRGSCFTVVLPLQCCASAQGEAVPQRYDLSQVLEALGGDEAELCSLVKLLLQDLHPLLQGLAQARGRGDWAQVGMQLQGIVGAVSVFGADPLLAAADTLRAALETGESGAVDRTSTNVLLEAEHLMHALSARVGIA